MCIAAFPAVSRRQRRILVFLLVGLCLILPQLAWALPDEDAPPTPSGFTFTPANGSTTTDARPVISVAYTSVKDKKQAIAPQSARLWLNGKEVTANCLNTPSFISYQSFVPMTSGTVTVTFEALTVEKQPIKHEWSFTITVAELITSIDHNAAGKELGEYEDLTVELKGQPQGKASFEIEDYRYDIPMEEVSPGVYRGTYRVQPKDSKLRGIVVGKLSWGTRTATKQCETPVSMWGNIFRVVIEEPKPDAVVPLNFKIKGRTRPNSRLIMVPALGFSDSMTAPSRMDQDTSMGSIPGEADANGDFVLEYGFLIKVPGLRAVLSVSAVDPAGNHSLPAVIRVKFGK